MYGLLLSMSWLLLLVTPANTYRIILSCCCHCHSLSCLFWQTGVTRSLQMSVWQISWGPCWNVGPSFIVVVEFWQPFFFLSFSECRDRVIRGTELFDFLRVKLLTVLSLIAFIWLTHLPKRYPALIWWLERQENPSLLSVKVQQSSCLLWMIQSHPKEEVQQLFWGGGALVLEAHLCGELHASCGPCC